MSVSWGPLEEKNPPGSGVSMSRLIAAMFAIAYTSSLFKPSVSGMGWPYACLGIVVVMSIPLQALFKTLQSWFESTPGKALIATLLGKVATGLETKMTTTSTVATSPTKPEGPG